LTYFNLRNLRKIKVRRLKNVTCADLRNLRKIGVRRSIILPKEKQPAHAPKMAGLATCAILVQRVVLFSPHLTFSTCAK